MPTAEELDAITPAALRAAGHIKWTSYGPDTLGAFVAETDLGTAPEVLAALDAAVAGELIGYLPHPIMRAMQEACATYQADAFGWAVRAGARAPAARRHPRPRGGDRPPVTARPAR